MVNNSFLTECEIEEIGFKRRGKNLKISRFAHFYGASNISLGDNVRIDDFCILSGSIAIGSNIHIAAYSALYGGNSGISISDFANISSRVCVYAISDDYSGHSMTNPTIPDCFKSVVDEKIAIGKHVIIGTGSTILPGVTLNEGTAVGAMSLIKSNTEAWKIYVGIPAKPIKERAKHCLELEKNFLKMEEK